MSASDWEQRKQEGHEFGWWAHPARTGCTCAWPDLLFACLALACVLKPVLCALQLLCMQSAPGAWKLAFKAQADADPELYSTIYTVCRAGRDYALTTAPKASLLILLHTSRISERLKMIQQALRTRGLQPTTLAVFTDHKAATEAAADTLAPLFSEAAVTALHISDLSDTGAPSAALQRLVQGPAHHLVR